MMTLAEREQAARLAYYREKVSHAPSRAGRRAAMRLLTLAAQGRTPENAHPPILTTRRPSQWSLKAVKRRRTT